MTVCMVIYTAMPYRCQRRHLCDRTGSFQRFFFCALSKAHPGTAAVLVDEFDAGSFESLPQNNQGCTSRFGYTGLYLSNRHDTDPGLTGEILLAPIEEAARCPALRRCDHRANMTNWCDSINSVEKGLTCLKYLL
jgi:hypothetical protein